MFDRVQDARGITPVIGIILLVAITVLLASTVAAFAFELGNRGGQSPVPTAALEFQYEAVAGGDDILTIVHKSGDTLDVSTLEIVVEAAACTAGDPNGRYDAASFGGASGSLSAGETVTIDGSVTCPGGNLDAAGATVRVAWIPNDESSSVLHSWTGPG